MYQATRVELNQVKNNPSHRIVSELVTFKQSGIPRVASVLAMPLPWINQPQTARNPNLLVLW